MAFITGKTPQGNCGAVNFANGRYTCGPVPDHPGIDPRVTDPINFFVRIEGEVGETVHLDIQWPVFDAQLCGVRKYNTKPFFTVAHRCIYRSDDAVNWQRIESVDTDTENWVHHLSLTLTAPVSYVSVNYFYSLAMFAALRRDLAVAPMVEEKVIGLSRDGQNIYLYKVTAPNAAPKKVVYLQGGQHCCEYGGPHLLDALLRYLTTEEAAPLLEKYEFHITPIVSVADWSAGYKDELLADSNTVWDTLCTPETKAVDAYLKALPVKPAVSMDLHNARSNFLISSAWVAPEMLKELKRFDGLVTKYCDYMAPNKSKYSETEKYANFKRYALENFGFGVTMELSRFGLYDRATQTETPLSRESFTRLAPQLTQAIDAYLRGEEA